jgi:N-acetylneuraminate synthase
MKIDGREIWPGHPPYIVAEIGASHGGSLDRCLETIEAAKAAGADAIKLQAYTADTITLDCDRPEFTIKDGPWKGKRMYDLYKKCETPFEWFPMIAEHAKAVGIKWFSSVFDRSSVDMLEKLDCPVYKIASFEIVDLPLIRYAARTGKPMIISTGMAIRKEIDDAISAYKREDNRGGLILLACVSEYPAKPESYSLTQQFERCRGVSDHTLGIEVPIAATALGAHMIEKHFTLDYKLNTEDMAFSLAPSAFRQMVDAVHNTWAALQPSKESADEIHRPYRRSLYAVANIKKGETFTHENVRSIRPGNGLPPKELDTIIGKTAAVDIERGTPMQWALVWELVG